jgi:hypothetical protein
VENSVQITALFGYCTRLPEDVWQAILAGAAVQLQSEASLLVTEGILKVKIDNGIEVTFAPDALETHFKGWASKINRTTRRYLREELEY